MDEMGPITRQFLEDPRLMATAWKLTPMSMAVRLSGGQYRPLDYAKLLSRKLMDVATGRCPRLIVCMPPRHGKSELVSKWFPLWYLETFQDRKLILCSYAEDYVAQYGGMVRDIILANKDLLSVRLAERNPPKQFWKTNKDGAMICAGMSGQITGKGANVFIVDDYVKDNKEALSPAIRQITWDWWRGTAHSRFEPVMDVKTGRTSVNVGVVVMATRWHSDDLIGRIIEQKKAAADRGEKLLPWEVFVFPAEAEPEAEQYYRRQGLIVNSLRTDILESNSDPTPSLHEMLDEAANPEWRDVLGRKRGDPLWPEKYGKDYLAECKSTGIKEWYALYQQRPGDEAEDGNAYYRFDEHKNCKPLRRDDRAQLFVSMDFNVNPMSVVIGQYDHGLGSRIMDRCEVLEELVIPNSNTSLMMERLVMELRKYYCGWTLDIEVYGDAAGTQRTPNSAKTNWQIVSEYLSMDTSITYRMMRRARNPMVLDRVNAVNSLLCAVDGTVRLLIDDAKCPELIQDFKKVRMQQDSDGNSTGTLDKSDSKRTHISDALGYMIEFNFGSKSVAGARKGLMR